MDLKRQELRRLRLPAQQGRSPPQPPTASPGCSPIFYFSLHLSPTPLPPLLPCDEGLPSPPDPMSRWVGGQVGGTGDGKGPNTSFNTANAAKSPGRLCSTPGPAHCNRNTDYLFMKRPRWRSGFTAAIRAGLLRTSIPSLRPHRGPSSPPGRGETAEGPRRSCPRIDLLFFLFSPGITGDVKSSSGLLRASGGHGVLVLRRTPLFRNVPNICGIRGVWAPT